MWILSESMQNRHSIDKALEFAVNNNFDKVFVQVRSRGDALYRTEIVNSSQHNYSNFDPLAYAIEKGHKFGLEVHAWVNTYILWSSRFKPRNSEHLYYTQKDWTEANHYSKMDWRIDLSKPPHLFWEGIYLAPTHPEVNNYLRTVFREIITNYHIDGVHLDYIRYQDDYYGYNPAGRADFKNIHGVDPIDIARGIISTRFGWERTYVDSMRYKLTKFKQDKVTELVQFVREDIDKSQKNIQLSAAVKPNLYSAKTRWFQDWQSWLNDGLLDFAIPMNYYKDSSDFMYDIKVMTDSLSPAMMNKIIMGVATYNQDAKSSADKVLLARMNGFSGICIFSYDSHKNNLDWFIPVFEALETSID